MVVGVILYLLIVYIYIYIYLYILLLLLWGDLESEIVSLSLNLPEVMVELPRTVIHRVAATRVVPFSAVAVSSSQSPFN